MECLWLVSNEHFWRLSDPEKLRSAEPGLLDYLGRALTLAISSAFRS